MQHVSCTTDFAVVIMLRSYICATATYIHKNMIIQGGLNSLIVDNKVGIQSVSYSLVLAGFGLIWFSWLYGYLSHLKSESYAVKIKVGLVRELIKIK